MARDPYEVTLTDDQRNDFARWLSDEVRMAVDAKSAEDRAIAYWHLIYEQARTRLASVAPWPGAADLTSYIGTQNVDAIHARLMKTMAVDPMFTVDGWGASAKNAALVEEFTQWKVEEDRLQSDLDKLGLISLIEPRGLIEVYEDTTTRTVRKTMNVAIKTDATGGPVYDDGGQIMLQQDDQGKFIAALPDQPASQTVIDSTETVRKGPQQRVIPYRDSVILPGHARERREIWGYGKRLWKRPPEILKAAEAGLYDKTQVDRLNMTTDRVPDDALRRSNMAIAPQQGPTVEKELWEVLVLCSPDGKPERWYLATIHLDQHILLRLQFDDLQRSRFVPVILFPRPDRATEGFSFIGHKLITVIEEHTACRNMIADRSAMANGAPIKRMLGSTWDPQEQPWGPGCVIDVRDMREIEPVQVPDVPASVIQREQTMERTGERLAGINDISSGQFATQDKTLGEIQMATEQSFVRMDLVIRRFQEAMEDLAQIRHAIWTRVVAQEAGGIEPPSTIMTGLEARGMELPNGRVTAALLEGDFRFKPRGSVETADPRAMRMDFVQFMQMFPGIVQMVPMMMQTFGPEAVRAFFDWMIRVMRIPNRQAFLGGMAQQMAAQLQPPSPPGVPGQPGLPPGPPTPPGLPAPPLTLPSAPIHGPSNGLGTLPPGIPPALLAMMGPVMGH
jgi:hypothetical protein